MPAKYIRPSRKPLMPPARTPLPALGAEAGPTTVGRVSGRTTAPSPARKDPAFGGAISLPVIPSAQGAPAALPGRAVTWSNTYRDRNLLGNLMRPAAGFDETPQSFQRELARRRALLAQLHMRGLVRGA